MNCMHIPVSLELFLSCAAETGLCIKQFYVSPALVLHVSEQGQSALPPHCSYDQEDEPAAVHCALNFDIYRYAMLSTTVPETRRHSLNKGTVSSCLQFKRLYSKIG